MKLDLVENILTCSRAVCLLQDDMNTCNPNGCQWNLKKLNIVQDHIQIISWGFLVLPHLKTVLGTQSSTK